MKKIETVKVSNDLERARSDRQSLFKKRGGNSKKTRHQYKETMSVI